LGAQLRALLTLVDAQRSSRPSIEVAATKLRALVTLVAFEGAALDLAMTLESALVGTSVVPAAMASDSPA
jgi:hypothetical protein